MKLKLNNVLNFASYSYRNEVRPTILTQQANGNVRLLHIVFKYSARVCVCLCVWYQARLQLPLIVERVESSLKRVWPHAVSFYRRGPPDESITHWNVSWRRSFIDIKAVVCSDVTAFIGVWPPLNEAAPQMFAGLISDKHLQQRERERNRKVNARLSVCLDYLRSALVDSRPKLWFMSKYLQK